MSNIDWIVMFGTLILIGAYGIYKTRHEKNIENYLRGSGNNWWGICLSVMATQASAVTFLSLPGQAYDDGMRFVQFYFGLPIAMVLISVFFIPIFYRLKVYTAYEFLENRFDYKTRAFTAILFLIQRGMGAGITIYAPAIILSQLLHWDLNYTILFIGTVTTLYIIFGGSKAIAVTHKQQMAVIFLGMFVAFGFLVYYLTQHLSISQMFKMSGDLGKLNL
ncbi:MAG: sodium:solute symporter, partial [Chitinophagales bacterium]